MEKQKTKKSAVIEDVRIGAGSIDDLVQDDKNFNKGTELGGELMDNSLRRFGLGRSILIDKHNRIIAGNKTAGKAQDLGLGKLLVVETTGDTLVAVKRTDIDLDTPEGRELALADNATSHANLQWDEEAIREITQQYEAFTPEDWAVNLDELTSLDEASDLRKNDDCVRLFEKFLIPPFSILDAKAGYWMKRKEEWSSLGFRSQDGRDVRTFGGKVLWKEFNSTSIFDPVLCEISYRWFNLEGGRILDPFAGGSVRGIVASTLGYEYHGIDIREVQITENREQEADINNRLNLGLATNWYIGDSRQMDDILPEGLMFDMLFSCPPYADLEVYSDLEGDISNLGYDEFLEAYTDIIHKGVNRLKNNRFAVFVVGDIRDNRGIYRGFVQDTIKAFESSGMLFYNDMILATQLGSSSLRTSQFNKSRKAVKVHQNVLVFFKGDVARIREAYGDVEVADISEFIYQKDEQ